jgi:hypothetical protein
MCAWCVDAQSCCDTSLLSTCVVRLTCVRCVLLPLGLLLLRCSRPNSAGVELDAGADASMVVPGASATAARGGGAFDAEDALWRAAETQDEAALARLAIHYGALGLEESAAATPSRLPTALRAAGYAEGLHATAWLARAVSHAGVERESALSALHEIAARKRLQHDPEDAPELKEACLTLSTFATGSEGTAEERARTVAILRMLADYGCMMRAQITNKLDSK